ncbi:hypothetical protein C8J57DRAFT_1214379 [Mycena rebaudengoi]|nr:hypothetical protein C8J57DRAFT_1214379 [Mycena rebaudengoi]
MPLATFWLVSSKQQHPISSPLQNHGTCGALSSPAPSTLLHTLDFRLPTALSSTQRSRRWSTHSWARHIMVLVIVQWIPAPIRLQTRPHNVRCPIAHGPLPSYSLPALCMIYLALSPFDALMDDHWELAAQPPVQPASVPVRMRAAWMLRVSVYTDCSAAQQVLFGYQLNGVFVEHVQCRHAMTL